MKKVLAAAFSALFIFTGCGKDVSTNEIKSSDGGDGDISSPNSPITIKTAIMIEDDQNGNPRVQVTMNEFLGD